MPRFNYLYILDGQTPVAEPDVAKWAQWFAYSERTVALTKLGGNGHEVRVSTVFLGMDRGFIAALGDRPLLFETRVFGGALDGDAARYSTWAEAEAGHKAMVERVGSNG